MNIIEVSHLTKDYGHQRGVFDVSIQVNKGECYGFLGPNGAGKTTTIRHLMGFSKPQSGTCTIQDKDTWIHSATLQNEIGYLPGEIALPTGLSGTEFLENMAKMRHLKDDSYCQELIKKFELDPNISTKKMSLGVKRKLAIVTAFMHDPDILILDEPTSGLDPIMQQVFIDFIISEKKRGKTIFLSSHIFHEIDATCDRISIIKDGKIVSEFMANDLKNLDEKTYRITFNDQASYEKFIKLPYTFTSKNKAKTRARVSIDVHQVDQLIQDISTLNVKDFHEFPFTLENYFMQFYKEDKEYKGVQL